MSAQRRSATQGVVTLVDLKEVCDVTPGPSGSLLERLNDGPHGTPVISPSDITDQQAIDIRRLRRVPESDAERLSRFALREGDILVVRQGALGKTALVGSAHIGNLYNSSCIRLRPRREIVNPDYLASYLSLPRTLDRLLDNAIPGTVPSINSNLLKELSIALPSLSEQQDLVATINDLDSYIRIQNEIVDRLRGVRESVFEEIDEEAIG